ncbi:ras association domain-containing protein 6 isoform X2 [Amia ocellicauda]|uniref:ras association domain-containing protein 6 isoform X2 n=1 Tax=Amia ocellicauda TaxID=2972642 RepID=UPI0034648A6E
MKQEGNNIVVDGLLIISWGVQRPIRLKIQDEKQVLSFMNPSSPDPTSPLGGKRGMTRWGEFDDLHHIDEMEETKQETPAENSNHNSGHNPYECSTLKLPRAQAALEEASNLYRSMSDASLVKKRVKSKAAAERQHARHHRCSINGHFYNYKTSIFTPVFGTSTNVRINSKMTTDEVITQLLHKFKIENDPNEFALYCLHQSGERRKLNNRDFPLWERLLLGPSEKIAKMFLMEQDEQEVSTDVAQYLNFELPILEGFLHKLEEEENREVQKIITKYRQRRHVIQHIHSKKMPRTETTV